MKSARGALEVAVAADQAGFWGFGAVDTAPALYQAAYPTLAWSLERTEQVRVGPMVTNPITQHWSVHASTARTFEELAPGRSFLGMGTGDGAVHSVGLRPAKWQTVEDTVRRVREFVPDLDVHIASAGPKGAEAAGRVATDFVSSLGFDAVALRGHVERARAARREARVSEPLRLWSLAPLCIVDHERDLERVRADLRASANSVARLTFDFTFADKNVPERWQPILRERLAAYDFGHHGVAGRSNPNGLLFEDHPEIQEYLLDRMLLIGTGEQCRDRVVSLRNEVTIDGFWFTMLPNPDQPDPIVRLRKAADAFGEFLNAP